mmetsp:Transcript_9584/g.31900  ORF Transcript_9584/g.31900 Transcript_9584/m.31900 type:complete len:204 (+) Transcript_9584:2880-3491(+)
MRRRRRRGLLRWRRSCSRRGRGWRRPSASPPAPRPRRWPRRRQARARLGRCGRSLRCRGTRRRSCERRLPPLSRHSSWRSGPPQTPPAPRRRAASCSRCRKRCARRKARRRRPGRRGTEQWRSWRRRGGRRRRCGRKRGAGSTRLPARARRGRRWRRRRRERVRCGESWSRLGHRRGSRRRGEARRRRRRSGRRRARRRCRPS